MSKTSTISALLKVATPVQLARVRAHLESEESHWNSNYTPMEHALASQALRAFDAEEYFPETISRYMTPDVIEKIFA